VLRSASVSAGASPSPREVRVLHGLSFGQNLFGARARKSRAPCGHLPRACRLEAFDNNALRRELNERGALAVIPSKQDRKTPIPHDAEMYKWRHLVENCIQRLKEWRRIATRYDKTDTSFCAFIHLSAALRAIT
jgi:transposase